MSDLVEFLLARIAEDEEAARESASVLLIIRTERCAVLGSNEHKTYMHFDRHGPKRVLAECEAKRRIVEEHGGGADPCDHAYDTSMMGWMCTTLRLLALPYADHPDYDSAWRT